jgi:hypothetical protein
MPVGLTVAYFSVLIISGVAMVVLAGVGFGQAVGARVVEAVAAAAFLGYAGCLLLLAAGRCSFPFGPWWDRYSGSGTRYGRAAGCASGTRDSRPHTPPTHVTVG